MKSKITLINIISSLILQAVTLLSGFIVPKIILSYFGSNVNGLVSSLNQFLSYISLIEGGITGVILANLYKPLIENDKKKLSAILVTAKKFFCKIGYIFIAYTIGITIVYPLLSNEEFSWMYVSTLTLILSLYLIIQYLFSVTYRTLLQADKKVYIVSIAQIIITVCNIICAYVSVSIYPSIHLLKLATGLLYIIQPVVYGFYVKKHYKIDWKAKPDNGLIKGRWNGFAINCASFIHNSTDITILTIFTNLATVSIYSVYVLVTSGLRRFLDAIYGAVSPTLGQAYAKSESNEINEKLDLFEFITFVTVFFCFTVAGLLITPFVQLYTAGISDADYCQPIFGMLIVLSEALYLVKSPHVSLAYSANKFKELTAPAFIEAGINIVISLLSVKGMGLVGVAIGTICGMVYRMAFHVYYTTKLINGRYQWIFYRKLVLFTLFTVIGIVLCDGLIPLEQVTVFNWVIHAVLYCLVFAVLYFLLTVLAFRKELDFLVRYVKK